MDRGGDLRRPHSQRDSTESASVGPLSGFLTSSPPLMWSGIAASPGSPTRTLNSLKR